MKKIIISLLIVMVVSGCANGSVDPPPDDPAEEVELVSSDSPKNPSTSDLESSPDRGPCGSAFEKKIFVLDGETITLIVPIPCDPFWKLKDRGDPPPGIK